MRKTAILLALLLLLGGCAPAQEPPAPAEPEPVPEELPEEPVDVEQSPVIPETEEPEPVRYEYSYQYANMSVELPAGWSCDIAAAGVGDVCEPEEDVQEEPAGQFGLIFWPDEQPNVAFSLYHYLMGFGVCGVGLSEEQVTLDSGYTVLIGTFDNGKNWDFVSFCDTPGSYVLQFAGTAEDWTAWEDEVDAILQTIRVGEGVISRPEAIAAAEEICLVDHDTVYTEFDSISGVWSVRFCLPESPDEGQIVRLDSTGEVLTRVPEAWKRE